MFKQKLLAGLYLIAGAIPCGSVCAEPAAPPAIPDNDAKQVTDAKPAQTGAKSDVATETVDRLVEQLDSADFDKREEACSKLAAKGKVAIPALEKAATKGDLEVCSRALGVLGKLLKSSDEKTSKASEEALQRLADGDSPAAARKAKSMLDKKNGASETGRPFGPNGGFGMPMPGGGFGGGRIIINGGMLQIGGGAAVKTLSVSNNNGIREIKATDGDKTIKIEDDPANGIKIQCTDKVNGKEVTKKYDAKNVTDLKKNQPEGYKLYKEYGDQGNGGAVQLQFQGGAPLMPVIPAIPAVPRRPMLPPVAVPATDRGAKLDRTTARLKDIAAQLDALRRNETLKDAPAEKKAELKKQIGELSRRVDELQEQLDDK